MELAKKSGERYPPTTVYGIVFGIRRYLEEKNGAEGLNALDNCDKRLDVHISKIKMTLWLEQSRFIIVMHVLFFRVLSCFILFLFLFKHISHCLPPKRLGLSRGLAIIQ